jgi:hypothetical protein
MVIKVNYRQFVSDTLASTILVQNVFYANGSKVEQLEIFMVFCDSSLLHVVLERRALKTLTTSLMPITVAMELEIKTVVLSHLHHKSSRAKIGYFAHLLPSMTANML